MSVPKLALNKKDAAIACSVSLDTIERALRCGDIKPAKACIDNEPIARVLIPVKELERWLENKTRK